jgi:hypothetical protein
VSAKISADVRCGFCAYGATHRADTVLEVAEFLRRLLFTHCEAAHPEQFTRVRNIGAVLVVTGTGKAS